MTVSAKRRRSFRRWVVLSALGTLILAILLLLAQPRARAALGWVTGFSPLAREPRVFFETGAAEVAQKFADALPRATQRVEETHGLPFKSDFRVYVCATHESFIEHLGHPLNSPVRGLVMLDIWVSPLAFDFHGQDTHRQTLAHELSHLHVRQHLGWTRSTRNIPTWFAEGLADVVADTGGEIFTRQMALEAIAEGRHFVPDAHGKFPIPRSLRDYGVPAPLLHQQSRMFVEYLRARDPDRFRAFVISVLLGGGFSTSFETHLDNDLETVWHDFLGSLG